MFYDRQAVDLVRALVDLSKPGIPPEAFRGVAVHISMVAHELDGLVADLEGDIRANHLGRSPSRRNWAAAMRDHCARRPIGSICMSASVELNLLIIDQAFWPEIGPAQNSRRVRRPRGHVRTPWRRLGLGRVEHVTVVGPAAAAASL